VIDKDPLMDEFRHDTFRLKMYSLVGRESQYSCEGYINVKTAVEMAGSAEDNAEERVTHDGSERHVDQPSHCSNRPSPRRKILHPPYKLPADCRLFD
jgi:hypothetical protein